MKRFVKPSRETWASICKRPIKKRAELELIVKNILSKVKLEGDKALYEFSEKYDGTVVGNLKATPDEIAGSADFIPADLREAIKVAKANIEKFHKAQLIDEPVIETSVGVKCWRKNVPVETVGLYIPGGTAPLFS